MTKNIFPTKILFFTNNFLGPKILFVILSYIKLQKKWKYDDIKCEGCHENIESGEEVLRCDELGINVYQADYTWFYSELVSKQIMAGKVMMKKLKKRKQIREEVTWRKILVHPKKRVLVKIFVLLSQTPECSDNLSSCSSISIYLNLYGFHIYISHILKKIFD